MKLHTIHPGQWLVENSVIRPYNDNKKPTESDYYKRKSEGVSWGCYLRQQYSDFELFSDKHTYTTDLTPGIYNAEGLQLIWQYTNGHVVGWCNAPIVRYDEYETFEAYKKESDYHDTQTRQIVTAKLEQKHSVSKESLPTEIERESKPESSTITDGGETFKDDITGEIYDSNLYSKISSVVVGWCNERFSNPETLTGQLHDLFKSMEVQPVQPSQQEEILLLEARQARINYSNAFIGEKGEDYWLMLPAANRVKIEDLLLLFDALVEQSQHTAKALISKELKNGK